METECNGLRTTALDDCPDLAAYIGQVNVFKRRYAAILIGGTFRDTVGANVRELPLSVRLRPYEAAVLLVLRD